MGKFVKFTEYNDWEGETWRFYLQLDGNEKALKELDVLLNTFFEDGEEFSLNMTPIEESDVDALVKHGGQGYMDYHNKVVGEMKIPQFEDSEIMQDKLYKGGIRDLFKK